MNLDQLFQKNARRDPGHPAIIGPGFDRRLTYGGLDAAIAERAAQLEQAGVGPGDTIGLHLPSGVEYIISTYAIWRLKACVVPIPVELAPDEKRQIVEQIHLEAVISFESDAEAIAGQTSASPARLAPETVLLPVQNSQAVPPGFSDLNSAFIRFTSGTTGDFKGVVLSHQTIWERIVAANAALELGPEDRVLWLLSMSYHFAVSIVGYLTFGATILLPKNLFASAMLQTAEEHQATFIYGSPLQYAWMADCERATRLDAVRLAISTTSPLTKELAEAFMQRFGLPLTQALGIIEVGLPCINVDFASTHPEAVGKVLPAYEVRLEETGIGEEYGELLLSGPGFLDAYYDPWRLRDDLLRDGWFATGDVCTIDQQGCVHLQGRSKDVINISGMKFFPQETEAVLNRYPGVRASRVYPVHDSRWGELAYAQLIAEPDLDPLPTAGEISAWCKQHLAPYKIPVDLEFVKEFPKTASGKILHRAKELTD